MDIFLPTQLAAYPSQPILRNLSFATQWLATQWLATQWL